LWVAGFACLWLPAADDPPLASGGLVLATTPQSLTVGVITADATPATARLFDAQGVAVAQLAASPRRRHEFTFPRLTAGTTYDFEIELGDGRVERGRTRTAPADDAVPVRFAFLGDSGDQPWWVWLQRAPAWHWPARWGWFPDVAEVTQVGAAVAAFDPSFVIHLGDIVYPWGRHAHYRPGFFRPFAEVLSHAPVWAVLGNHDVMDARGLQAIQNLRPRGEQPRGDGRNFSHAFGPVRVIGLDCNLDQTGARFEPGHPTHAFLLRELAACTEPWIIVASHFPIRSGSRSRGRPDLQLHLLPQLVRHQVSLYLCGHDHCYQRFEASGGEPHQVISGGGGKSLYEVQPHARAQVQAPVFHWCSGELRGGRLQVRAHAIDGAILDDFEVRLPAGERLTELQGHNPARARRVAAMPK
jgi:hypothetical protein